jgi:hypothetical protein
MAPSVVMFCFSIWLLEGYLFSIYNLALFLFFNGLTVLGVGAWVLNKGILPRATIDTYELSIQYCVHSSGISGTLIKLSDLDKVSDI